MSPKGLKTQNYFTDKKQTKLTAPSVDTRPRRLGGGEVFAGKRPTRGGGGSARAPGKGASGFQGV